MSGEMPAYMAHFQRGVLLRSQCRHKEAAEFLGKAIEVDPERALTYVELALSLNDWGHQERKTLGTINRAISLEPTNARFVGLKGWIYYTQIKDRRLLSQECQPR